MGPPKPSLTGRTTTAEVVTSRRVTAACILARQRSQGIIPKHLSSVGSAGAPPAPRPGRPSRFCHFGRLFVPGAGVCDCERSRTGDNFTTYHSTQRAPGAAFPFVVPQGSAGNVVDYT
ncbi:hypothetical protein EVAR_64007_1 [Eumeta japonica]|uniref:Uncharacterized protein n=1 Tax=Eumeta variegata TaxID=151549 RepID=A0A4C1Z1M6_EUMVA|nr:hypothetical protein EVAR_64007_1 [Eumeta japonica]